MKCNNHEPELKTTKDLSDLYIHYITVTTWNLSTLHFGLHKNSDNSPIYHRLLLAFSLHRCRLQLHSATPIMESKSAPSKHSWALQRPRILQALPESEELKSQKQHHLHPRSLTAKALKSYRAPKGKWSSQPSFFRDYVKLWGSTWWTNNEILVGQ